MHIVQMRGNPAEHITSIRFFDKIWAIVLWHTRLQNRGFRNHTKFSTTTRPNTELGPQAYDIHEKSLFNRDCTNDMIIMTFEIIFLFTLKILNYEIFVYL